MFYIRMCYLQKNFLVSRVDDKHAATCIRVFTGEPQGNERVARKVDEANRTSMMPEVSEDFQFMQLFSFPLVVVLQFAFFDQISMVFDEPVVGYSVFVSGILFQTAFCRRFQGPILVFLTAKG